MDDHPLNRRIFVEMLGQWGMEPIDVASGEQALETLRAPPGLVCRFG